jgi:hypothetical protein
MLAWVAGVALLAVLLAAGAIVWYQKECIPKARR